ncbi:DMT family transporter [Bordetella bronchialis]|uniref:DMT family transporter n=1 Tax=Bordetella bronchialis TaxID=463025 RepID=UPI003D0758AE
MERIASEMAVHAGGRTAKARAGRLRGYALLGVAIVLWGANWPVMKAGLAHVTPVWFSAIRFGLGALTLFGLQAATGTLRAPRRADLPVMLSVGLLQMLAFTVLGAVAMTHVPAGRSAILAYTTPVWVIPIAVLVFGETLSRGQKAGSALALAGVLVLFNPASFDWHDAPLVRANVLLLLAAFCWAVCILHLRHGRAVSGAYQLAPWQMLIAATLLVPMARVLEGPFTGDGSLAFWEVALYVGPLATAFCFVAVNAASSWLSSTTMSTAMLGVPVVGLAMAGLVLGEPMTGGLLAGLVAIVAGIAIVTLSGVRRRA